MRIDPEPKFDFSDVLIRPKRSTLTSRKEVDLTRNVKFMHSGKSWTGVPIIASNMDTTGTFEMAKKLSKLQMITCLHKFYGPEELARFFASFNAPDYVAYTLGIRDEDFDKLVEVLRLGLGKDFNFICLDVPNGYLERYVEMVRQLRKLCPTHTIMAGNVVTNEMTEQLVIEGVDIVKIGIGSGSACLTRRQTGVGYPQLSAVVECADAAHGISVDNSCGRIISDGGIQYPGDIAKAFCAGADFVMIGTLFSGFEESGGVIVEKDGQKFKEYYGMSSRKAMEKHYGGMDTYRASEGRNVLIPYKGLITPYLEELLGSLRSTGTYIGARKLKEFSKRATFIQVQRQLSTLLENY